MKRLVSLCVLVALVVVLGLQNQASAKLFKHRCKTCEPAACAPAACAPAAYGPTAPAPCKAVAPAPAPCKAVAPSCDATKCAACPVGPVKKLFAKVCDKCKCEKCVCKTKTKVRVCEPPKACPPCKCSACPPVVKTDKVVTRHRHRARNIKHCC